MSAPSEKLLSELGEVGRIHWNDSTGDIAHEAATLIRTLQAENAELRKDAERYRWLRKGSKSKDELLAYVLFNKDPDQCIDAAIAASPK